MNIKFKSTWWLKWYWPYVETLYEIEGHYGTRQSGKTHQIARKLIYHSFGNEQFNVIHCRKEYNKIEGSTFKILKDIVTTYFPNDFTIIKDHFQIINKHTGNWFRGLGMDKEENAKSVEGANIAWLNESNQFTIDDYDYLGTTIRGKQGVKVSMILDWNPQSVQHWIKAESDKFNLNPKCVLVKSTFWDNYLIDRNQLHEKLLTIKERDENLYNVWALGEWGVEDPQMNFFRDFSRSKHIKEVEAFTNTYYLTFDLNYDPSCLLIQRDAHRLYVLEEFHTKGQGLPELLSIVKERFKLNAINVIVNGDSSGNHSRNITDSRTSYQIIQNVLGLSMNNFHVQKANPTHVASRILSNIVLRTKDFKIHPRCVQLINDVENMQVDNRGSLDPWKKENPLTGHLGDALRYHIFYEDYDLSNVNLN